MKSKLPLPLRWIINLIIFIVYIFVINFTVGFVFGFVVTIMGHNISEYMDFLRNLWWVGLVGAGVTIFFRKFFYLLADSSPKTTTEEIQ